MCSFFFSKLSMWIQIIKEVELVNTHIMTVTMGIIFVTVVTVELKWTAIHLIPRLGSY